MLLFALLDLKLSFMTKSTPPPESLVINKKKDHFFISIAKKGVHSFIMLGIYDQNKVQQLLCRVGKFGDIGVKDPHYFLKLQFICNSLFFTNKGGLADEGLSRKKRGRHPITYQAYDINYEQYLEFVSILESLQSDDCKFKCYKPDTTTGDEVTLKPSQERKLSPINVDKIKTSVNELNVGKTCRHSAIDLVEATQHAPVPSLVSSMFFMDLPYETVLEYGSPSKDIPFYVLPPPPAAFHELDNAKEKVITKLYSRMENMLLLEPTSEHTQNKFLRLKELYLKIVGPENELSLDELLKEIQVWKETNKATLDVLRKTYFWDSLPFVKRQSATMNLITEVEDEIKKECVNRTHGKNI